MRLASGLASLALMVPLVAVAQAQMKPNEPPPAHREFRAAWVATVGNIDWPTKAGLSKEDQQREIVQILNRARTLKLNAIVFQVRASADAMYRSQIEPWSQSLSGTQGEDPGYDPLAMWIDEAHKRGMELHAWFNPYRARHDKGTPEGAAPNHISRNHPDWAKPYGKQMWMDPGVQAAQDQTYAVFMDVVKRYDIDGVHIDDYFYPYPEKLNENDEKDARMIPFPDDETYQAYKSGGGKMLRDDWRRDNINRLMKRLYDGIKAEKKQVKFGISPFGIARPGKPEYVKGFDQYKELYADAEKWLKEGWCDYMVPQLYWRIGAPQQPYLGLLRWWTSEEVNPKHRQLMGGLYTSHIDWTEKTWCADEIAGQIMITRLTPEAAGHVHFSMRALTQNRNGLSDLLREGLYSQASLVPATTWLGDGTAPAAPTNVAAARLPAEEIASALAAVGEGELRNPPQDPTTKPTTQPFRPLTTKPAKELEKEKDLGGWRVTWKAPREQGAWLYAVYAKYGEDWRMNTVAGAQTEAFFRDTLVAAKTVAPTAFAVAAVDRLGNESPRAVIVVPAKK